MRYGLQDWEARGANGPHFPIQSSVLGEEALRSRVLGEYRIGRPHSCRFLTRGDADIYRVRTSTATYYLKVYRPPRSLQQTEAEASFVSALARAGIPVVNPVLRRDGRFALQVLAPEGVRPMLLFEEAPPALPSELGSDLLAQAGETIARLHAAADALNADPGLPEMDSRAFLGERVAYAARFLSHQEGDYLCRVSEALAALLSKLPRERPDFGLCHGDLVLSNLRLAADGAVTLFDFGDAMRTWRAYELAVLYWSLGHRHPDRRDDLWHAFLRGHESVRPLPEALAERLAIMLVLRQISFLGGNCATLPLRLGTEPFEGGFVARGMAELREFVDQAGGLSVA